jgi:benzoate-CoA ligase family protein
MGSGHRLVKSRKVASVDPLRIPEQFNAAEHFVDRHLAERRGEKVALECGEEHVTYAALQEQVNRCGNALRNLGIGPGDRVVLLLLDTPAFAYAFFGAIKIGAVAVPVNVLLKPADWQHILADSGARAVIVAQELSEAFLKVDRARLPALKFVLVSGGNALPRTPSLADEMSAASRELAPAPTNKDGPAFWLYSSGSTGAPKGCVHRHRDMVVCAERYARQVLGIREDDRFFSVAKLFFAYGLGNGLYFSLSVGATSILWPGSTSPANIYAVIERARPTLFFSVPSNFAALLTTTRNDRDYDLSSIRYAVSAGESLPAALYNRFRERFGVEILDAIGSTECLHMFIANRPGAARPGSSGQLISGYGARLLDENGEPVAAGEIGNLFIQSDATCAEYWNQPEKTRATIRDGWIRTGDKYRLDADGYYWYAGRSDDMLKVSGMWVSPVEIEAALIEHPAVLEAAVVAREDGERLVKPAAYVVLREGTGNDALAAELQKFVAQRLAAYKRPRWVEFLPDLPKTATGKIQRFKLR